MPEETPAPAAEKPAESGALDSIIHHSWGHHTDRKAVPEVGTSFWSLQRKQYVCP